jgi:hypothetical protein
MSYSVNQKCSQCKKESKCADGMIIKKAMEMIHSLPSNWIDGKLVQGHLGGGSVTHDCTYGFEDKNAAPEGAAGQ